MIGLLVAADRFDHRRQRRFSTYASYWIKKYVLEFVYNDSSIRLPQSAFFRTVNRRPQSLKALGTITVISNITPDISTEQTTRFDTEEDGILSRLVASGAVDVAWDILDGIEAQVLSLRFGFGVGTMLSSQDVARQIGKNRTTVYHIEKRALAKMHEYLTSIDIAAFGTLSYVA